MAIDNQETIKTEPHIRWQTFEYSHWEKSSDWFWLVGLVAFLGIILSIVFKNFLLAIIILIGGFSSMMYGSRKPESIGCEINPRGIKIKDLMFPMSNLESFSLREEFEPHTLYLKTKKLFSPKIAIPLNEVEPEIIRKFLSVYLPEEEHQESLLELIAERFGF